MIICPSCHHHEISGAIFCSECGAQLLDNSLNPSRTFVYQLGAKEGDVGDPTDIPSGSNFNRQNDPLHLSLLIIDSGTIIPLVGSMEYTIGRTGGKQPVLPDIDLTAYNAYEGGVSRLHATIKVFDGKIWITDLGSANGTRVNGQKISAHEACAVYHKDVLTLGNFKVQLLVE
jgi:pSer/pThr/pTyr-binding forkhead associated (FHA) protein